MKKLTNKKDFTNDETKITCPDCNKQINLDHFGSFTMKIQICSHCSNEFLVEYEITNNVEITTRSMEQKS